MAAELTQPVTGVNFDLASSHEHLAAHPAACVPGPDPTVSNIPEAGPSESSSVEPSRTPSH